MKLLDHEYLVGHVEPGLLLWGLRTVWSVDVRLLFADPARTVVDILDRPKLGGGIRHGAEVTAAYLDEHDPMSLIAAGDRLGNRAVFKRLGYIVEALGLDPPGLMAACEERASTGISILDPDGPAGGRRLMRWGLRLNVTLQHEDTS